MERMNNLLNYPRQKQTVSLPDGTSFTISLYYVTIQQGWFIDELSYKDFTVRGMRLVNSTNILRQYKNLIPFGLAVMTAGNREPMFMADLNNDTTKLFVLNSSEVELYEEYLSEQT